jgi:outer membrane protein OmpA-like peptidoglycan-associated protein
MQLKTTLSAIAATLALAGPAAAQMYPGQDVTVNPNAVPRGEYLLYPNGVYMRVQPGGEPIRLHMPRPHRHHVAKATTPTDTTVASTAPDASAAPSTDAAASAPSPPTPSATAPLPAPVPDVNSGGTADTATPPPKPSHHKHSKVATQTASNAAPTPAPATSAPAPNSTPATGDLPFMFATSGPPPATPAQPQQPSKPAKVTKVAATKPPPAQTTTAAPPAANEDSARQNLYKHGAIMFVKDATDPSPSQFDGVKTLATDLNAAIEAGASRIQIEAYGGPPGDKSSDARRLSLKRALAVRQLLIDDGVPSSRIDVRAMGGIDDKGPADRVDVYVRAS